MVRPAPQAVQAANETIGEQLQSWRKLYSLTAAQVAERAGIGLTTLQKIEQGNGGVNFQAVLRVAHVLGVLDRIITATDPYETDLGRARADQVLPRRVRS